MPWHMPDMVMMVLSITLLFHPMETALKKSGHWNMTRIQELITHLSWLIKTPMPWLILALVMMATSKLSILSHLIKLRPKYLMSPYPMITVPSRWLLMRPFITPTAVASIPI